MGIEHFFARTVRLREAASTIFALVTLVPFLVLVYFLHRYDALREPEAQIGLLLALALAILGFVLLQQTMARVSRLAGVVATGGASGPTDAAAAHVSGLGHVAEIGQIGSAFARMLDDLRTSTDRLEDLVFKLGALSEMVELAARVPNIQELMALVLERTMRTVRATAGSIMLVDRQVHRLRVVAARGSGDGGGGAEECALGEGVPGTVAQLGEAVVVDDVRRDARFAGDPRHVAGSFLCLPVRVEDRIIGVVNLARENGSGSCHGFTPTDLQFLQTLISHIAYSIDNARLLEETRQVASRLEDALCDLQTAQTRLVEGETLRAVGQMASGMAHHLNNLLAVVSGRIQLLLIHRPEAQVRLPLEIARRATEDAAEVVRRVLEFTARQPIVAAGSADLNELIGEVLELTRPRWHDQAQLAGITIEVALELADVPPVAGEVSGLREVLMNLVLNAVDAMPKGGRLTIRTWAGAGAQVHCSVGDSGIGMSDEVRHRVFQPFFTTKGPQGVGLGLSVSHAIIERHRGAMTVDSVSGIGTTVTFHLPPAPPDPAAPPEAPEPPIAVPLRILLVDDEAEVRATLGDSLSAHGHVVVVAANGREAIERLQSGDSFDAVLTDLGMPDMTGWDLARIVKERWPDMPVGLITGWGLRPHATEEQRQAVDFVVAKPFTIGGLLGAIADARAAR
jgi:signal transduction histidine kinase